MNDFENNFKSEFFKNLLLSNEYFNNFQNQNKYNDTDDVNVRDNDKKEGEYRAPSPSPSDVKSDMMEEKDSEVSFEFNSMFHDFIQVPRYYLSDQVEIIFNKESVWRFQEIWLF